MHGYTDNTEIQVDRYRTVGLNWGFVLFFPLGEERIELMLDRPYRCTPRKRLERHLQGRKCENVSSGTFLEQGMEITKRGMGRGDWQIILFI